MRRDQTRRAALKSGLTAGTLALVGPLAGCNSPSEDENGTNQTGANDTDGTNQTNGTNQTGANDTDGTNQTGDDGGDRPVPDVETPAYTRWLYAPGSVQDEQHSSFNYIDHSAVRAARGAIGDTSYDQISTYASQFPFEQLGAAYEDIETTLFHSVGRVATGSFERDRAVSALEESGFEQVGERAGYTVLSGADSATAEGAVAVSTGTVVSAEPFGASGASGPREAVAAAIDAREGAGDRYVETSADMARLTAVLGAGDTVSGSTRVAATTTNLSAGVFEGLVADGNRAQIRGESVQLRVALVFADREDIVTGDIEAWTETGDEFQGVTVSDISVRERTVVVTGEGATSGFVTG